MRKIAILGTATIDIVIQSQEVKIHQAHEALQLGAKLEVEKAEFFFGGGAMNVAASLSLWGFKPKIFISLAKDDIGKIIQKKIQEKSIKATIFWKNGHSPLSVVILAPTGERTILVYRGVSGDYSINELNQIPQNQDIYYIGTAQMDIKKLKYLFSKIKKNHNIIITNPSKKLYSGSKITPIISYIDIFIVNDEEFNLLQKNLGVFNMKKLFDYFKNKIVVITRGKENGYLLFQKKVFSFQPYKLKNVIDKTGAGDAFSAGFIFGLLQNKDLDLKTLEKAITLGAYNSYSVIQKTGAQQGIALKNKLLSLKPISLKEIKITDFQIP